MTFLITFIALSIINVVFSTVRTITTIKGGTALASLISGGYFAFYNVMLIYTVADFPMWQKCAITFCCNVAGVALVKWFEKRMQKDKLWKVEATVKDKYTEALSNALTSANIPFNRIELNIDSIFNIYCATQAQSAAVKEILKIFEAKYFVSESKTL